MIFVLLLQILYIAFNNNLYNSIESMDVMHDEARNLFRVEAEGHTAYVEYAVHDGALDILHTIVPSEIGGKGIASVLVKAAYDYALEHGLKPLATCSYAVVWLQRHPEYRR